MTDSQRESLNSLYIIECPHKKLIAGQYICLIHDKPCQYILNNNLNCLAEKYNDEREE